MHLHAYLEKEGPGARHRLAKAAGVRPATIYDIASGKNQPSVQTAKKIEAATAGAVTAAELLGIAAPPSSDGTEPPHAA